MEITRRQFLRNTLLGSVPGVCALSPGCRSALSSRSERQSRPNIIIIMVDDMGFSDVGCFGGEIDTPNLDSLAANGLRFTQFYNCARCCPTRASLMTGQYPHKVGLVQNGRDLTRNGITIAEALGQAGYQTAMAGKWHLSRTAPMADKKLHQKWLDHQYDSDQPFAPLETYPANRGFDRHYGVVWGVIDYFDPFSLVDGTEAVKTVPDDYYFTDAVTEKSVEYIEQFSRTDKPFFLYVAHCAPHWPLHARAADIAKYKNTYKGGWDKLRRERYQRMLKAGLFKKENTPLPPIQNGRRKWQQLSEEEKEFQAAKMAVHAAMIDRIDQGIGDIVGTLKATGQMDNTLIFFLSDNGASPEVMYQPGYDRTSQTRDGRKIRYQDIFELGAETTYACIGQAWASASNTPFRYWKKESYEGGCHTPLIIHWPKGLKTKPGSITEQTGHVMDIMPTCLELADVRYPAQYKGHKLTTLDGKSLAPILAGGKRKEHEKIFFEHMGGRAVRMDNWKLVALKKEPWRLYNLAQDRTETNDLATEHPARAQAMSAEWEKWAGQVGL
ncbi:MAG: arylsulfatase [Planctomycetes bacterium]|nr:arylsulfatase [Planctomycetota bacterium]